MTPHLKYLRYVILHKYYVLVAGRRVGGIPLWRLLVHDHSKFSRAEWGPYVQQFFGGAGNKAAFQAAWRHHWTHNWHHWNYWEGVAMPDTYIREMVADWMAAGKTQTGRWEVQEWYADNAHRMVFHPDTRKEVARLVRKHG